ncbi:MAG: sigma-54 dependent transcriptional regulator [Prevotellaceae bacterium]|jgi:transcriptional regulator with PAS, ATPase and Fis domain|nr:sigma-54 dependent transcriptional regulator [Prevotellaceae bacterium]
MTTDIQQIKQRFGIIGNNPELNRALDIACQVAQTDLSVLISGESGVGKEFFPQVIHNASLRKHSKYIAVNCGAIPEGTIDSELFGHEKGSFTDAKETRKGYFEVADKGTIFLDEVAELPMSTQVRLLRVLESGEFMKVGSSAVQKTNVRVIAATNVNLSYAIQNGRFREDLYYRLNTIPINIPPLRERKDDIYLLFRKFAGDFAEKYKMPVVSLTDDARIMLENYEWRGNIRQLKNITEQLSIIEEAREIDENMLSHYLPDQSATLPMIFEKTGSTNSFDTEREILYKILFDMKADINELKKVVHDLSLGRVTTYYPADTGSDFAQTNIVTSANPASVNITAKHKNITETEEIVDEPLSIIEKEIELIRKALEKHSGRRKLAAGELGISERTLYRKIKEHNI